MATEQDGGMLKRTEGQQALTKETNHCRIATKVINLTHTAGVNTTLAVEVAFKGPMMRLVSV